MLENLNYTGTKTYLDPLISVKCGADYMLSGRFSITGALGYSVFFESGSTGMYPVIDIGVKYNF